MYGEERQTMERSSSEARMGEEKHSFGTKLSPKYNVVQAAKNGDSI